MTETVALKLFADVGVNVTEMVQLAPAAKVELQVFVWANMLTLVPVIMMAVMFNAASPVLERVSVCAVLVVPTVTLPKERLVGLSVTWGAVTVAPIWTMRSWVGAAASDPPWRLNPPYWSARTPQMRGCLVARMVWAVLLVL